MDKESVQTVKTCTTNYLLQLKYDFKKFIKNEFTFRHKKLSLLVRAKVAKA